MSLSATADGRQVGKLTRTDAIEALREYAERYEPPTTAAFNPSTARWRGREDLAERYRDGREDGRSWPSLNSIKGVFDGSFSAALAAADLPMAKPGGTARRSKAAPIRDVRTERVYVQSDRDRELTDRITSLEDRLERALTRARRAEDRPVRVRERVVRERVPGRERVVTKTNDRIVTKVVEKPSAADKKRIAALERKLERAESNAIAAGARVKDMVDQNAKLARQLSKLEVDVAKVTLSRDEAVAEATQAVAAVNTHMDAELASKRLVRSLRAELSVARQDSGDEVERDLVKAAEARVELAERDRARAERRMAEQAQAVTGERRRMTKDEMAALRTKGPAGPAVLGKALAELSQARKDGNNVSAALTNLASAALMWRDQVR